MRKAALLIACASVFICAARASGSDSASQEACAGLPLKSLFNEAAPRSFAATAKTMAGFAHTGDLADKAVCSSISEPFTVIPEETPGLAERFCGLLRSELSRHGDTAKEAILGGPAPGDSAPPRFGSCDFFAQDGATTISARAVYILQADHSTRLLVMVSSW